MPCGLRSAALDTQEVALNGINGIIWIWFTHDIEDLLDNEVELGVFPCVKVRFFKRNILIQFNEHLINRGNRTRVPATARKSQKTEHYRWPAGEINQRGNSASEL